MISTDSNALRRARRSAFKAKTSLPCVSCLAYGGRCKQGRPCSRCTKLSKACVPTVPKKTMGLVELNKNYSQTNNQIPLSISSQHVTYSDESLRPSITETSHSPWPASYLGAAGISDARNQDGRQRWHLATASSSSEEEFMALVDAMLEASGEDYIAGSAGKAFAGGEPVSRASELTTAERISVRQLVHCDESDISALC